LGAERAAWERRLHAVSAHALYLHVPFCRRKCAYCDFPSWATPARDVSLEAYARSLERLVDEAAGMGLLEGCETAYVGGGTPSYLGEGLVSLVGRVREAAPGVSELTCEANPDSLTDDLLAGLVSAGATRVSIGVQSLRDAELAGLGRVHDAAAARDRVGAAVASGLDVSCDLMCAIPAQTADSWAATLEGALGLGVGHLSVYPLAIEEGTPLAARVGDEEPAWNSPDVQADRMEQARSAIEGRGLARYEVASYALPGKRCRHNVAYWTGVPYLGLGTGAASMLASEGYGRLRAACPQLPEPPDGAARARLTVESTPAEVASARSLAGLAFSCEFLTEREAAAEDLMLGSRLTCGLDPGLVEHAREAIGADAVGSELESLVRDGYLDASLAPTARGWLLGNELYGRLWGLASRA
jgi:putative oxygen-independent coproporphyrinogen III oxidase